ncbi:MAG: TerC family protein [Ignavibacteriaceae bacterium]|nr:TerC family protein [Ignavibacteriaceae bacterium]
MNAEIIVALLTLVALEIVLGIDNIIFISILSSKLPAEQQAKARIIGLGLALVTRILLLFSITLIMKLVAPLFTVMGNEISGRDVILITGGLFLIAKSTHEIHEKLEGEEGAGEKKVTASSFGSIIVQIVLLDIIFSLDSVITAVGMVSEIWIMITAVVVSIVFMMFFMAKISDYVNQRPTIKMLALSFLMLIGVTLVAEGIETHIPKGYIYFAMAFSFLVEMLNLRTTRRKQIEPVKLRTQFKEV